MVESRGAGPSGFTLVEVVVALIFLTVVALSLTSTTQFAARLMGRSELELQAAHFLEREAERLRATEIDSLVDGSRSAGLGEASWEIVDSTTFVQISLTTRYGTGVSGFLGDTVTILRLR